MKFVLGMRGGTWRGRRWNCYAESLSATLCGPGALRPAELGVAGTPVPNSLDDLGNYAGQAATLHAFLATRDPLT